MDWQPIETAPKDGTHVLLLSMIEPQVRCYIGHWDPNGDAWVDDYGRMGGDPDMDWDRASLRITGVWSSGFGWFEPMEVTHWQPLPEPPQNGS